MLNHYNQEDRAFVKRVTHLEGWFQTKFLNLNQQEIITHFHKDVKFYGGYPKAERKRAYSEDVPGIVAFKVDVDSPYPLTHQNVFGSLINMGLAQDALGDCLVQDEIYIFVMEEVAEFVKLNFTVNQFPTMLTEVDASNLKTEDTYEIISIFISSPRLDNLLSNVYNVSRNEAKNLISKSYVRINHKLVTNPSKDVEPNQIVSVRTKGRFKLLNQTGTSKKGNLAYEVAKY